MAATPYLWYGAHLLAYLLFREVEMSDPAPTTPSKRPRRATQDGSAPGARSDPQLRLRVVRRTEPDVRRLVEWVLNMTQARYNAHRAGEPDPYDLPAPDGLGPVSDERGRVEAEQPPQRRSTA